MINIPSPSFTSDPKLSRDKAIYNTKLMQSEYRQTVVVFNLCHYLSVMIPLVGVQPVLYPIHYSASFLVYCVNRGSSEIDALDRAKSKKQTSRQTPCIWENKTLNGGRRKKSVNRER